VANKIDHPPAVPLREDVIEDPHDTWLSQTFAPARIEHSLTAMEESQPDTDPRLEAAKRALKECDRKLARHRAALVAGADLVLIAT
jgi:hypothetical protein